MAYIFDSSAARVVLVWSWVTLTGRDGRDFLHRLTTVNVNALQIGQGSPGFFLNAQGKIRAYFTLWRFGVDDYAFELDAGSTGHWKTELLAAIDQYTFAEKFTIADISQLESRWIFAERDEIDKVLAALGASALKAGETAAIDDEIRICHHGDIDYGRTWLTAWGRPARLAQWLERSLPDSETISWERIEGWRLGALRPRVDAELDAGTIPLEVGLIDGLAQAKGCYPGQEVIERIVSLGSPARRLVQIVGQGHAPALGEKLHNLAEPPIEVGQVTSVASAENGSGFTALAFVRKIHAKEGLEVQFAISATRGAITRVSPYA